MTVSEAIALLTAVHGKHGDVDVYFDCPRCDKSFAPTVVKALAMHMSGPDSGPLSPTKPAKSGGIA